MADGQEHEPPRLAAYERLGLLGKGVTAGGGGGVWRERDRVTDEEVAIKYMKLDAAIPFANKNAVSELRNAHRAAGILGVVRFRCALHLPGWGVAIVMDLCRGPMLLDWTNSLWLLPDGSPRHVGEKAKRAEGSTEESLIRAVFVQLLRAVAALHASGTGHRDIKVWRAPSARVGLALLTRARPQLDNVCLTAGVCDLSVAPEVKLIDLGFSKSKTMQSAAGTLLGTPHYIAPEVYAAADAWTEYDQFKADTWALGIMLLIMIQFKYPLRGPQDQVIPKQALMAFGQHMAACGKLHSKLLEDLAKLHSSDAARKFILRCFTLEPQDRPTPTELLQDPWVTAGEPYPQVGSARLRSLLRKLLVRGLTAPSCLLQLPQTSAPPPVQTQSREELEALIEVLRKELQME
jgi:serine/threonine protein kinase